MEGRDIGTVVFPNAELKIFLEGVRSNAGRQRRWMEHQEKRREGFRGEGDGGSARAGQTGPRAKGFAAGARKKMQCWWTTRRWALKRPRD